ncbi:MAG: hypothetical protein IJ235_07910, partial [Eubacterium sp.]|nr:hypothetical protein [Eubacterium sp.]
VVVALIVAFLVGKAVSKHKAEQQFENEMSSIASEAESNLADTNDALDEYNNAHSTTAGDSTSSTDTIYGKIDNDIYINEHFDLTYVITKNFRFYTYDEIANTSSGVSIESSTGMPKMSVTSNAYIDSMAIEDSSGSSISTIVMGGTDLDASVFLKSYVDGAVNSQINPSISDEETITVAGRPAVSRTAKFEKSGMKIEMVFFAIKQGKDILIGQVLTTEKSTSTAKDYLALFEQYS